MSSSSFRAKNIEELLQVRQRNKSRADSLFLAVQSACDAAHHLDRLLLPDLQENDDDDDEGTIEMIEDEVSRRRRQRRSSIFDDEDGSFALELETQSELSQRLQEELAKAEEEWIMNLATRRHRPSYNNNNNNNNNVTMMEELMEEAADIVETVARRHSGNSGNDRSNTVVSKKEHDVLVEDDGDTRTRTAISYMDEEQTEQLLVETLKSHPTLSSRLWSALPSSASGITTTTTTTTTTTLLPSRLLGKPVLTIALLCTAKLIYNASQQQQQASSISSR